MQTAMFAQKATEGGGRGEVGYCDAEYIGGFSCFYVIGLDGSATFINNYVGGTLEYVGRIAGMLLINGKMESVLQVAALVPVCPLNAAPGGRSHGSCGFCLLA